MNKINILFLSSLMLVGSGAFGMQAIKDLRKGVTDARTNVKATGNNLPNRYVENASDEIKGLNKDIKGLKKETDNIVNSVFELSETVGSFGGYKQRYNSHINTLANLKSEAKQGNELDFDKDDFKNLIDQEAATLKKQPQQRPMASRNGRQQPVQKVVPVMQGHVDQLKRSVDAFNNAINNQGNIQQQKRAVAPGINNRRLSVADARKALNKTIEDFEKALERQREAVCAKSTLGDFVYGGSNTRSLVTLAVVALGALYLGQSVKASETGQVLTGWFTEGSDIIKTVFTGMFDWIKAKLA